MKNLIIMSIAFLACGADVRAQSALDFGIYRGGYSPAFQMLMQEQSRSGVESCTAPKHSAPKCVNPTGPYSRKSWRGAPPECGDEGGERGEIRAVESATGQACMVDGYCFCGSPT